MDGNITISKVSCTDIEDYIKISIKSKNSGEGIEAKISLKNFSEALMGLARTKCELNLTPDFDKINKTKKVIEVVAELGNENCTKEEAIEELKKMCPPSVFLKDDFNRQNTFFRNKNNVKCIRGYAVVWE